MHGIIDKKFEISFLFFDISQNKNLIQVPMSIDILSSSIEQEENLKKKKKKKKKKNKSSELTIDENV